MSTSESTPKSRWTTLAVCTVGLIGLYFLSVGPYMWGYTRGYISHQIEQQYGKFVYYPIDWLYLNVDWFRAALQWYLSLWGVH